MSKTSGPGSIDQKGSIPVEARPAESGSRLTVVAIGASAGGLDACSRLLDAMPQGSGAAFILVQHFDPSHRSLMVDLLSTHTALTVLEAEDGESIEPEHFYVIKPGTYLTVTGSKFRVVSAPAGHGARFPFNALLQSVAEEFESRAVSVVLSGNGTDGSLGLKAIKDHGGFTIAQSPVEAEFDGMPNSAISTGLVDQIASIAAIPALLLEHLRHPKSIQTTDSRDVSGPRALAAILALLSETTGHDFRGYKQGTIERRIARRMALIGDKAPTLTSYLDWLRGTRTELDQLVSDLLINVTSFFRDPKVFTYLAETVVPELIGSRSDGDTIRVWSAGCSSGQEAYSLAIVVMEAIAASGRKIALQVFASDADSDAIAIARTGFYDDSIVSEVPPKHLARYFERADQGYQVSTALRAVVVFSVQDVLKDPPFSRLDLASCRNLLIYLDPESQSKVMALFHFALRPGGVLLLGSAETVGNSESHFEVMSKSERCYRHLGKVSPPEITTAVTSKPEEPKTPSAVHDTAVPRSASVAEVCRRLLLEHFAPAAVLIDATNRVVYSTGPTEDFLRTPNGYASQDLLAMVRTSLRQTLRSAIEEARTTGVRVRAPGARGKAVSFTLDVQALQHDEQSLVLVCFVRVEKVVADDASEGMPGSERVVELEHEIESLRSDLFEALHDLESATEEHRATDEESLSVNEEFQSTNEELVTSKEELQSLNEELTALNGQLQETLERQRTTSNDLQNVLYSTDLATVFLDTKLRIRFFTPATRALFRVIPGDIGRPLSDLAALAVDTTLLTDAVAVLKSLVPLEREIEARTGAWYNRRVLPYRTQEGGIEGVVITFANITERRHSAESLEAAERKARTANVAKSRFLAAASHDLRQPLQTLKLVQGLLVKAMPSEKARSLIARLDETVAAMSGMLNSLLDINQIEAGIVHAERVSFPINDLLVRLRREFSYLAQSQGLAFRVVQSSVMVDSDPRLLEQMVRNLLVNAVKYTKAGKILLGCRRQNGAITIEIVDTGIGIAAGELDAIFDEFHQLDNEARDRSRGLGLGLSIVKRLGDLLGHKITVRSLPAKGSAFSIEVPRASSDTLRTTKQALPPKIGARGKILVVEDDPDIRELLEILLVEEGHTVRTAADGPASKALISKESFRPDLIVADYNLPNGMDGIEAIIDLRAALRKAVPAIVLTGDISTKALVEIGLQDCLHLNKPIKAMDLTGAIERLLAAVDQSKLPPENPKPAGGTSATVYVVDDDDLVRASIRQVLEEGGQKVEDFPTAEAFLAGYRPGLEACLLVDAYMPGMNGIDLIDQLKNSRRLLPSIVITGGSDVSMAVAVMKAGAIDFLEKPVGGQELIAAVTRALGQARDASIGNAWHVSAAAKIAGLTKRQHEIMTLVLAGNPNKNIAADLGLSQRTVENHRAAIMQKTGAKSLPALARLAIAAAPMPAPLG